MLKLFLLTAAAVGVFTTAADAYLVTVIPFLPGFVVVVVFVAVVAAVVVVSVVVAAVVVVASVVVVAAVVDASSVIVAAVLAAFAVVAAVAPVVVAGGLAVVDLAVAVGFAVVALALAVNYFAYSWSPREEVDKGTLVLGDILNDVFEPLTCALRTYMPPLRMQFAFRSEYSIGVSIDTFFRKVG